MRPHACLLTTTQLLLPSGVADGREARHQPPAVSACPHPATAAGAVAGGGGRCWLGKRTALFVALLVCRGYQHPCGSHPRSSCTAVGSGTDEHSFHRRETVLPPSPGGRALRCLLQKPDFIPYRKIARNGTGMAREGLVHSSINNNISTTHTFVKGWT